jgi:type VI secretion system Hcp family effector
MSTPSITYWSRLEPRPRSNAIARPLAAPVRDPLWFLTRQWQLGEFRGEDAGSPAFAQIAMRQSALTGWRSGNGPFQPLPPDQPLELLVESEPFTPDVPLQVELAQTYESFLGAKAPASFLATYPLQPPANSDAETTRFLSICSGRSFNGIALYRDIVASPALFPAPAAANFVAWVQQVYGDFGLSDPPAWNPEQLEYDVQILGTTPDAKTAVFSAEPAQDGGFDWHTFDLLPNAQLAAGDLDKVAPAPVDSTTRSVIPGHVRFRGMPNARWWDFENNITDFGGIQLGKRDFAKLAAMDFLLLHGNDWFVIPVDLPVNSLSVIDQLVVHDVFGDNTLVQRAEDVDGPSGHWTMFSTTIQGQAQPANFFLLPPTAAAAVQSGTLIEDVRWIRDPMANMDWAIERQTEGGIGQPLLGRERAAAARKPLVADSAIAPLVYLLENQVPLNWIPFLPIAINAIQGQIVLQMGAMLPPDLDPAPVRPIGRILNSTNLPPGGPYTLREEEIARVGIQVSRVLARTRWLDGSTHLWTARRKNGGQGEGSSSLKFDLALSVPVKDTVSSPSPKEFTGMPFLITITGAVQGLFKGESLVPGEDNQSIGLGFSYDVSVPTDPDSGLPTGKRRHAPIRITKAVGVASPQIFRALVDNETISEARFDFFKINAAGVKDVVYIVRISNAHIVDVKQTIDPTSNPGQPLDGIEYETVAFTFGKFEISDPVGMQDVTDNIP